MGALGRAISFADGVLERLDACGVPVASDALALIEERQKYTGFGPTGRTSAGGSCRLLRASDGWCAVNLPREDDLELLAAWVGIEHAGVVPWDALAESIGDRRAEAVVADGQLLGLAVSRLPDDAIDEQLVTRSTTNPARPWIVRRVGERVASRSLDGLRVVDLSSLWAGPLCARFLGRAGARVVKVESSTRPDGARGGDPGFWSAMLDGHEEVPIDFERDREALLAMIRSADVVIEQSRPRAFDRLGLVPADFVSERPGSVWVSITAYGRCGPWMDRVGFGDDAAVAGGLVDLDEDGAPSFVGDAIADPLTGMTAAALVAGACRSGGGVTIDVSLREVARSAATSASPVW